MKKLVQKVISDTRGSFVEYIILTGLVALALIVTYRTFGTTIAAKVTEQAGQVTGIK